MFHAESGPKVGRFDLFFDLIQPLPYLAWFAPLLGWAPTESGICPLAWFVPGMLVMLVSFSTASAGWALAEELDAGVHELYLGSRCKAGLLWKRALSELLPVFGLAPLVLPICPLFGLALPPFEMLLWLLVLLASGAGATALSCALVIASRHERFPLRRKAPTCTTSSRSAARARTT
jgi:ABC-2 type transport system permease protein